MTGNARVSIREEYAKRLPAFAQQFVTRFSGKAAAGQAAPKRVVPGGVNVALTLAQWPAAIAVGAATLMTHPVLGIVSLPPLWLASVNALRKDQAVLGHHAVHREIAETQQKNYAIQVVLSSASFVHNWEDYFEDHVRGHHSRKIFTTAADPDAAFLMQMGFRPGMSPRALWRQLRRTVASPRFHMIFLQARIRTNFVTAPWHRRLAAAAWLAGLAGAAVLMPAWVFVATVVIPLLPLYHVSGLLQFLSEHAWLTTENAAGSKEEYAARTWGRFCLEPLPASDLAGWAKVRGWARWAARMALVQLPTRYGVVMGDLPVHDLHHLFPAEHDWTRSLWVRQQRIDRGESQGMENREFYKLADAIDAVFDGMSRACQEPCVSA
ncbi:hypothetical protein [Blastococcus sp. PRF04-17]|uniref:hypothetical protein n=1 Tax=Blastococcus sp. PRF04-17 TaxID=2933797 RepID=UPI001FF67629|nr:hypothetical protein [Blastococcus sp. PRF04-17]UOY03719.1 hypothetical protein MVA48_10470 [Blastococcus sp. PRF04-17]